MSGSQDGTVHVWSSETGQKVTVLDGGHPSPTYNVQFNPKLMMAASALQQYCILVT
ncbi:WD repeat-containing protein 82 [Geodia barretti]|uniref:WD repeat-containing protein 82 n=1 Tax=Geodia barretti TaxID=519541 RepID=A0AA35W438_GEOBA|nr:WD repeat-containing protein 82 [Geodia barretti]